jgi:hypothetical protein
MSNATSEMDATLPANEAPRSPSPELQYRDAEEMRHQVAELFLTQRWKQPNRSPDIPKRSHPPPSLLRMERMPRDKRFPPGIDYFTEHLVVEPPKNNALRFLHKPLLKSPYTSLHFLCWQRMTSLGFERAMNRASKFIEVQEQGLGAQLHQAKRFLETDSKGKLELFLRREAAWVYTDNKLNGAAKDDQPKHNVALLVDIGTPNNGERDIRIVKQVWKERCVWEVRIMVPGSVEEARDRQDSANYASGENVSDVEQDTMVVEQDTMVVEQDTMVVEQDTMVVEQDTMVQDTMVQDTMV